MQIPHFPLNHQWTTVILAIIFLIHFKYWQWNSLQSQQFSQFQICWRLFLTCLWNLKGIFQRFQIDRWKIHQRFRQRISLETAGIFINDRSESSSQTSWREDSSDRSERKGVCLVDSQTSLESTSKTPERSPESTRLLSFQIENLTGGFDRSIEQQLLKGHFSQLLRITDWSSEVLSTVDQSWDEFQERRHHCPLGIDWT